MDFWVQRHAGGWGSNQGGVFHLFQRPERQQVTLLGGAMQPVEGFFLVFFHAQAAPIQQAQAVLCPLVSFLRSQKEPHGGFRVVPGNSVSLLV